jgi:hypothetical protein
MLLASLQDIVNPGSKPRDEQPRTLTLVVAHIDSNLPASAPRNINIGRNAVEISESRRTQLQKWEGGHLRGRRNWQPFAGRFPDA